MTEQPGGEVTIHRRIDRERELILARGHFGSLFAAYEDHVRTWKLPLDSLGQIMMRQALGGLALYLSSRPRDESLALTFNFAQPPLNVFCSGRSEEGTVTGRFFSENVATAGASRLYVQSSRAGGKQFTSVIDVEGLDLLVILGDYCDRSEQSPARFFELSDEEYLLATSLPLEDRDWFQNLDRDEALRLYEAARPLDEKEFRFHCGCDPNRMKAAVRSMFAGRFDELYGEDAAIEVSCPRCGRAWTLRRDQIEEGKEES